MESYAKNLPINELITELDAYMVELGYTASTLRHKRNAWNALKNLAAKKGATYFSKELGFELLREHYKIEPYARNLKHHKANVRRAVMLLLEYQISGTIATRTPRSDIEFPKEYSLLGERYIQYLENSLNLKKGTVRNHRWILIKTFTFFKNHDALDVSSIDTDLISCYLKTFLGYSKSYIYSIISCLNCLFEFAFEENIVETQIIIPKFPVYKDRNVAEYYTGEEISKILSVIDRSNPLGKRNYAMILIGARYGLRISDIKALMLESVNFRKNQISIIQQKTSNSLTLDLLPDVGWAIIDYLKNGRPESPHKNIFLKHTHPHIPIADTSTMQFMIRQYALSAGIKKTPKDKSSFHMLRYGLASDLISQNISLTTISNILGHAELNTTTKYTQLNMKQLSDCALEVDYD